ncbi:MAG TPA: sialidase family protein [Frankiaceae bacterium]|nr:sialidase family protein [Frankiaceae bacterium]
MRLRLLAAVTVLPLLAVVLAPAEAKRRTAVAAPAFASYAAPAGVGESAGEPSIGVDPSGTVFFQALLETLKVTGLDTGSPVWQDVAPLHTQLQTQDPVLETDEVTGRTWVSQLDLACSRVAYSDDSGTTWTPSAIGCAPGALFDHQSIGSGPWVPGTPLAGVATYPRAVYYCAHDGFDSKCGTSVDGGATFLPARVTHTGDVCASNSGQVQAAPDGTVYLPPTYCGVDFGPVQVPTHAGVVVSEDNGLSWHVRPVPGSTVGSAGHPSLDVASDGTVYYGWGGRGGDYWGPPYAAVTRDRGVTWSPPVRLGAEHGIQNTRFVTTVAGDGDRAAVAYLGSTTPGVADDAAFAGEWHVYVSYTYDRGATWSTVNATPGQPVQVGAVCLLGSVSCAAGTRNLYDFQDAVIDAQGRVLVAVADGCPGATCTSTAPRAQKATIVRQETGRGLLAAYDGTF